MARVRWNRIAVVLSCVCACCVACNGGARSTLNVPHSVELEGTSTTVPVSVQVRSPSGEPMAGIAVRLTVSGAALPATITPATGTTDATGSMAATLTVVTWGNVTVTATLGAGETTLSSEVVVSCTNGAAGWAVQPSSPATVLRPTRLRAVAGGTTPIRLLVSADYQAWGMGERITASVPSLCFRVSSDRPDVTLTPFAGRTPATYRPGEVLAVSSTPGPATITAETQYGTATVNVEFLATPAWNRIDAATPDAPVDARAVAVVPGGDEIVVFADGRLLASSDRGATWTTSAAPPFSPTQQSQWMDPSTWFELAASPVVPGLVMGLSRFSGGDAVASTDGGLTFTTVASGVGGIRVHPLSGEWLVWPSSPGAPLIGSAHADGWHAGSFPITPAENWKYYGPTFSYLPAPAPSSWLLIAWLSQAFMSSDLVSPRLWALAFDGSGNDVTGRLFDGAVPSSSYEYLYWTVDVATAVDDPAFVLLSTRRGVKYGPSAYGQPWTGAWTSRDAGATWSSTTPWSGRVFASASTGVFRIDTNGVVWKWTPVGEVDASLGLPDPVRSVAFDPSRPGIVYAATANGVFVTTTGGE